MTQSVCVCVYGTEYVTVCVCDKEYYSHSGQQLILGLSLT